MTSKPFSANTVDERLAARHPLARNLKTGSPLPTRITNQAHAMAAMLTGSGIAHLLIPDKFDWMVPTELPGTPRFYTITSGLAEITAGLLLLTTPTRRLGATAAATIFVGVLPANINGVRLWWNKPWPMPLIPILRLPLQIPLITTTLSIRRHHRRLPTQPHGSRTRTGVPGQPLMS